MEKFLQSDEISLKGAAFKLSEAISSAFSAAETEEVTKADILTPEDFATQEMRAGLVHLPTMVSGLNKLTKHRRAVKLFGPQPI